MNKKSIYFGGLLLAALTLSSCASDDTATEKPAGKDTPKSGTVFSSETEPSTRTSATYTGSGLDFYWTASDKIWVKDDNGTYRQNSDDDIATRIAAVPGSTTTDKAKFWVNGSYTGSTHKVRYTGKNGTKDKVTIKASQTQNTPNDAAHIADDGDFGVADATGSGSYNFTLNHKAAYVTFMPYNTNGKIGGVIQKIRISTSNPSDHLAGTFDLADDGTLSNPTGTSNSVELNLSNFSIPQVSTYTQNAAIMVVNPGTYSNVTIEYTLHDAVTNVSGTIKRTYPSVTFDAGKNTPVRTDMRIKVYHGNEYYMWDAVDPYWKGYEWNNPNPTNRQQPTANGINNANYPKSKITDLNRWYNDSNPGKNLWVNAQTNHFKSLPNINEMAWYCQKGEPHWDADILWSTMGHLYKGAMWFKKKNKISGFNDTVAPDGRDLRTDDDQTCDNNTIINSVPSASEINDYFLLPALGNYDQGTMNVFGIIGTYWSSTAIGVNAPNTADNTRTGAGLGFRNNIVWIFIDYRRFGARIESFE